MAFLHRWYTFGRTAGYESFKLNCGVLCLIIFATALDLPTLKVFC